MAIELQPEPTTTLGLDEIRLGDLAVWMRPDREGIFAKLRAEAPISFHDEPVPPFDAVGELPSRSEHRRLTRGEIIGEVFAFRCDILTG